MNYIWEKIKNQPALKKKQIIKSKVLGAIREFFQKEGFMEIDTPCLVKFPDPSPFNEVFEFSSLNQERLYLTPSPEFFLKKFLVAGFKNVYQITKAYRDQQENDPLHLKEFTILEWYRDNADYTDLMIDCENLVSFIQERLQNIVKSSKCPLRPSFSEASKVKSCSSKLKINYLGKKIDLTPPWMRISCKEAFKKYANVNLDEFLDIEKAREICQQKGYQINKNNSWEELYHQIFLNEVEPKLPKENPLILYDYPSPLAALSKIKESDSQYAERFEFYIGGLELGNGYSELTDFQEQEKRLINDMKTRGERKMKVFDYDHDFVAALKEGMNKTTGIAVGIDRLVMLFTDSTDIHEVTPFAL